MKAVVCIFTALTITAGAAAAERPVLHHDVVIRISLENNPPLHPRVHVVDHLSVPQGVDTLFVNESVERFYVTTEDRWDPNERRPCGPQLVQITVPSDSLKAVDVATVLGTEHRFGNADLVFVYAAYWHESTADVTFSRENVGREIQGTVGEEGIYLAADGWLPYAEGVQATHRLTIHTPLGWEPVTQGERVRHEVVGDELITVWDAPNPSDGLILVANKYHVTERQFGDVTAYTYFLADEPKLVETYMGHTERYLDMYGEMIGPYPYAKFATVENWFPTGYGMPSWTLLGGTVLRLPFIPTTSFGHEIAHNWWGNSAFVDDAEGNWCEGLTVYCADYHYKTIESDEAGREYRRNLLKDYVAYVRDGRDLPLSAFRERHSGATRAIGYGKSMMVFHMADRMIGREAFLAALREVWSSHMYRPVAWSDFIHAFGVHGGVDMSWFGAQWLSREGAPSFRLAGVSQVGDVVDINITQDDPLWRVDLPVVVETPAGPIEHVVTTEDHDVSIRFEAPGATAVHVDPDYHVFRRLHPQEIEPTLNLVLGDPKPRFVLPGGLLAEAGRTFAEDWTESDDPSIVAADAPPDGHARILLNPEAGALAALLPPEAVVSGNLLFLSGQRHDLSDKDAVLAVASPDASGATWLVVLCRSASRMERLAGRLSHYGKYSHLVFPARGRALRGNWPVSQSPLSAELH